MIEALVAAVLTGLGVAVVVQGMGSLNLAQAKLSEKERMVNLAKSKLDELVISKEFTTTTDGDFTDRNEDRYTWTVTVDTTSVENLSQVAVTVSRTQDREVSETAYAAVYEPPEDSGTTP